MKKILIITTQPIPIGLAGTNRILSISKGFLLNNYKTQIVCLKPTELSGRVLNNKALGNYTEIDYIYPGGNTVINTIKLLAILQFIKSLILSMVYLFKELYKKNIHFVVFYDNLFYAELPAIALCKSFGIKIFKEESENPNIYLKSRIVSFKLGIPKVYINVMYKLYSGLFVMTLPLQKFFYTTL